MTLAFISEKIEANNSEIIDGNIFFALSDIGIKNDYEAWKKAIINRPITQRLIFHSDRGVQYASHTIKKELEKYPVTQSMSRKGNCWDNAVAENYFKILKSELVNHTQFHSILQAKTEVFEFIEIWYNRIRKHSYIGYKTPEQYGKINYLKSA